MPQRQTILVIATVSLVAVAGGYQLIQTRYVEPRAELQKEIATETQRQATLSGALAAKATTYERWTRKTSHTLSADADQAQLLFREDVQSLLRAHDMTQSQMVRPMTEKRFKSGSFREGFAEIMVSVSVDATLEQLIAFQRALYERPYPVHVKSLIVTPRLVPAERRAALRTAAGEGPKPGRNGGAARRGHAAAENEELLRISMQLSTLVLPKIAAAGHPTLDPAALKPEEGAEPAVASSLLWREDAAEYQQIVANNPFKVYEPPPPPPPPPPPKVVTPEPRVAQAEPPPPPPQPDPREDADKYVVIGTYAMDGEPRVIVRDDDNVVDPPLHYGLNEEVDDGKLILIDPAGIVIRAKPWKEARYRNFFYPLGANFKERVEVNPQEHPEIFHLLQQVLSRS